jgi:hypothetical protein
MLLGCFLDMFVRGAFDDAFEKHLACFDLLRIMLTILQRGDAAGIPCLRQAMQTHHVLDAKLYRLIPKVHGQIHVVDFWSYWGSLLSCFGPERPHNLMQRVMVCSYKAGDRTTPAYDVSYWLRNVMLPELYMPIHLSGTQRNWEYSLPRPGGGVVHFTTWSADLNTPNGLICKGDVLQYTDGGVVSTGFAAGFAQAATTQPVEFAAVVWPCKRLSDNTWEPQSSELRVAPLATVCGATPWRRDGTPIAPMLHATS